MPKDLFSDPFENVVQAQSRPRKAHAEFVESTWTDKRTGAEYRIKERMPTGPQGDFRVPEDQADMRFRQAMGLGAVAFTERVDFNEAFEASEPESAVDQSVLNKKIRQRALNDIKRAQAFSMSSEPFESAFEDRESYTVNDKGQIRDKPVGTVGPFATETERQRAPPSKLTRETVPVVPAVKHVATKRASEPGILDISKVETVLADAFRGLFGESVANHIVSKSVSNARYGPEVSQLTRSIMDAGLMKPWKPNVAKSDRPTKPETLEYAVGSRALDQIMSQKSIPELRDMPRAERDNLTKALGRTILNAMTLMPEKASNKSERDALERHEDVRKFIASAIRPEILQGLVAPELLSDRQTKDMALVPRVSGTSHTRPGDSQMPDRSSTFDQVREDSQDAKTLATRPTLGSFSEFGLQRRAKKNMFEE